MQYSFIFIYNFKQLFLKKWDKNPEKVNFFETNILSRKINK